MKPGDNASSTHTDVNFLLLGFLLVWSGFGPDFQEQAFYTLANEGDYFWSVSQAVPTLRGVPAGVVHDPKARVRESMLEVQVQLTIVEISGNFPGVLFTGSFAEILSQNYALGRRERFSGLESGRRLLTIQVIQEPSSYNAPIRSKLFLYQSDHER